MEHTRQQALAGPSYLPRHPILRELLESVGNYGTDLWGVFALLIAQASADIESLIHGHHRTTHHYD